MILTCSWYVIKAFLTICPFVGLLQVGLVASWQSYFESLGVNGSPPPSVFTSAELVLGR